MPISSIGRLYHSEMDYLHTPWPLESTGGGETWNFCEQHETLQPFVASLSSIKICYTGFYIFPITKTIDKILALNKCRAELHYLLCLMPKRKFRSWLIDLSVLCSYIYFGVMFLWLGLLWVICRDFSQVCYILPIMGYQITNLKNFIVLIGLTS